MLRNFGTAVLRWRSLIAGVWLTSVPLLERPLCKAFYCGQRFCDRLSPKLAADCDGRGVFRAETLGWPMFSGVRGGNLA